MASTAGWASIGDNNRIDSLARTLAENVLREISQRNVQNEYLRGMGAAAAADFIIDMRKWHISKESPSLASSPFLTSEQEKNLNGKLGQFYDDYRHPVYVVLSPIVHGSYEFSTQGLKDVYDWLGQEMSFSDFQKLKERYGQYLKELQKYSAKAPTMTGALSHGAILSVESYIFYKSTTKNWMVRYGSDFTVADEIKRASFIEDDYESATNNASKFEFAGKRYTALDNHTNTIIAAFKNNCLTYAKLGQLAAILKDNLAELNKPIYVKVMEPKTWALQKRKYYLDKREQERYENLLEDTQGGGLFFAADDDGYINLNDLKADDQKASVVSDLPKVADLFSKLEQLIINVGVLWDIWQKSGDFDSFLIGNKSKAEILLDEAKDGKLYDITILPDVVGLRKESVSKISYDLLSEDEMRVAINALYRVQEALKHTFGDKSLYPFAQVENLERIKVSPLEKYKLTPAKSSEELLKQLKYIYENDPSSLTKEEIQMYFDLLCQIEGDCKSLDIIELNTINKDLKGHPHPETGVLFIEKIIEYQGRRYRGVFPKFEYKFRLKLPERLYTSTDDEQFVSATRQLKKSITENPELANKFTKEQLEDIQNELPRIRELTWHHSEDVGILELVDREIHQKTSHTGGRNIWGGGSENR
jgi:hypothetical protein